jgi:5-methylcytosine-specific restriction endonuclease McrA
MKPLLKRPKIVSKVRRTPAQGYTDNWPDITRNIKERDGHKCTICGATHKLEVHHIIPLSKGGRNIPINFTTLCHSCHRRKHGHQ